MRVLIAGHTYYPSLNGIATFMVNLAEGLAGRGHQVVVLFPKDHAISEIRNGVRIETFRAMRTEFIHPETFLPLPSGKIRWIFESFQPEIVHVQDQTPVSWWVVRQARRRGIKVIGTNHIGPANLAPYIPGSAHMQPWLDKILWTWILGLYRQVDLVTAPSEAAVNALRVQGLPPHIPAVVVSCGTNLGRFHPDPNLDRRACRAEYGLHPDRALFIYVGRVDPEKKLELLLRAMALLKRDDIQLAIAGRGRETSKLQKLAETLGLEDRVRFLGFIPNERLPRLLNSADVFAMAGEAETLSLASLEAMACGLPLLLPDVFAMKELYTSEVNALLFKSGDPREAARCMEFLLGQREHWPEMGQASLEKVQPHSLDIVLHNYETLYRQMLEPTSRTPASAVN